MYRLPSKSLDFAALLPGVGVFGGVRRILEIGNELVRRGHRYVVYHTDGNRPEWIDFTGEVRPIADLRWARHQVMICNDSALVSDFERARGDLKLFYFVLENIRGERAIARHSRWTLLANSTGIRERLHTKYGVDAEEVIGGVNLDVFTPRPDEERSDGEYRVLAFGRLSRKKKGVPIVLRAAESFARRYRRTENGRPVKLVLFDHVGAGNETDPSKELRCSVPYEFHLNLPQKELARLYAGCDAFVSAERRAGWANTVAEAMACGVPVVCTRSGTRDLAVHRDTAWVARWRHQWFVRQGLGALSSDPQLAGRLRERALSNVRRFSWPRVADQLESVVRKRLGPPSL